MRSCLALLLLLGLVACAATPDAVDAGPPPPLAAAALAEWQAWGSVTVEGWPASRPADTAATPGRFARLVGYWTAVPGGSEVARRLRSQREAVAATLGEQGSREETPGGAPAAAPGPEDIAIYAYPFWSAAFISAVARRAGIWEEDLPSAQSHARYVDAALARAADDPRNAAFLPQAPTEYAPRPGDLLCADRSRQPLGHWTERLAETGRSRPMHCDVVVGTGSRVVEAVGGNVDEMVVKRRFPADAAGRVLPAPPGEAVFFLVLAAH